MDIKEKFDQIKYEWMKEIVKDKHRFYKNIKKNILTPANSEITQLPSKSNLMI